MPSAVGVPLDRASSPSSSSPLPLSTSESSLSAVGAGEFLFGAFFTRDSEDLLIVFFLATAVGVPRRPPAIVVDLTDVDLGPALPALTTDPAPLATFPLGVPGPNDACLAKPLEVTGTVPNPEFIRGPRFVDGPAELSLCRFKMILAAGVAGADEACCCA